MDLHVNPVNPVILSKLISSSLGNSIDDRPRLLRCTAIVGCLRVPQVALIGPISLIFLQATFARIPSS